MQLKGRHPSNTMTDASSGWRLALDVCIYRELTVHYDKFFFSWFMSCCGTTKQKYHDINLTCNSYRDQTMFHIYSTSQMSECIDNFGISNTSLVTICNGGIKVLDRTKNGKD